MAFHLSKNQEYFWSRRKLLSNYLLLHFQEGNYSAEDFRFTMPTPYEKSSRPDTSADILIELLGFHNMGVSIHEIMAGPGLRALMTEIGLSEYTNFTPKQLRNLSSAAFMVLAPLITFTFKTDTKKQRDVLHSYLKSYKSGKLNSRGELPVLSYSFVEDLFDQIARKLILQQGKEILLHLSGDHHDLFLTLFSELAPKEHKLWCANKIKLPLLEHLLVWTELEKRIEITGFDLNPCKLHIQIPARKPKVSKSIFSRRAGNTIRLIEVLDQENNSEMTVYINQDYFHPFSFRKSSKTGKIILTLAKEGSVELKGLEKIYDYFFQYDRFPLFKKGKYSSTPLLDKFEETDLTGEDSTKYIIPHKHVRFEIILEKDIV